MSKFKVGDRIKHPYTELVYVFTGKVRDGWYILLAPNGDEWEKPKNLIDDFYVKVPSKLEKALD